MRVALYYAPAVDDPLWRAGCDWLGRDPEANVDRPQPSVADIAALTVDARRYGFHATLKPPMRLAGGWAGFLADARALAARLAPFDLPPLAVADLSGFLALRETEPSPPLRALADACVEAVDRHRAPPDAAELARRQARGLSPERAANLARWGYPDVFATWRFHMTLTIRLDAARQASVRDAAARHFAAALARPRRVADIALFTEPAPGAPFLLAERLPLGG